MKTATRNLVLLGVMGAVILTAAYANGLLGAPPAPAPGNTAMEEHGKQLERILGEIRYAFPGQVNIYLVGACGPDAKPTFSNAKITYCTDVAGVTFLCATVEGKKVLINPLQIAAVQLIE